MAKEMTQHIRKCMRCNCFKRKAKLAPLEPILATHPMQIVHIDFLTIESGKKDKDHNVLVVTDQFTRFTQAFVTTSQTMLKQLLRPCGINTLCIMGSQKWSFLTGEGTLTVEWLVSCASWEEWRNSGPLPITHKVMGSTRGSMLPCWVCWEPYCQKSKLPGQTR